MDQLLKWMEEGSIQSSPITTFEEVAEAHKLIESGMSVGKIILNT